MNTIRYILLTMLAIMSNVIQAQTVKVMKEGKVVMEIPASEMDSVVITKTYYYYAGWECPSNMEELTSRGTIIKNYKSLVSGTLIKNYIANPIENSERKQYSVVIPEGCGIYDANGTHITKYFQDVSKVTWNGINYVVVKSDFEDRSIDAIIIIKE